MYSGIRFEGYKLFPEGREIEFNQFSNMNVIIGKNNSGKSSLLDILEMAFDLKSFNLLKDQISSLIVKCPFNIEMVNDLFSINSQIGKWNRKNYWEEVKGKSIWVNFIKPKVPYDKKNYPVIYDKEIPLTNTSYFQRVINKVEDERKNICFRRISADRDIIPEKESELKLSSTGEGATDLIRAFLNDSLFDESVIENTLLNALNTIMYPEALFKNIRIQQINSEGEGLWEIYLQEENMPRVALSQSGSGIKTIILVLLNLLVIPLLPEYKNKTIVYGFEELENNLHPAMQRKLFKYICDFAVANDLKVFITTHSHVAINLFYNKENANIYHVIKEGHDATVKEIDSYIDKVEILDDLDIKASDIFQSNGIIWVEGPSDRIYIKKWLQIFCDDQFEEGKDYQFLYYGGKLLSHYSVEEAENLISIITTNRNAAIVIDSDKKNRNASINDTKKRIQNEFNQMGLFCWITKGKEIENYIPKEAILKLTGKEDIGQCKQYNSFIEYIEPIYKQFKYNKVKFANEIKSFITKENSSSMYDLKNQILELNKCIKKWNE